MIRRSFLNFFSRKRPSVADKKTTARKSLKIEALEDRHMLSVTFETPILNDYEAETGNITVNPELPKHQMVFSADFDNDGKSDILIIDRNSSKAITYINNGNKTDAFSGKPIEFAPSEGLRLIDRATVGKVDNDGNVDLVTGYYQDGTLNISVYRGTGGGGFFSSGAIASTYSGFDADILKGALNLTIPDKSKVDTLLNGVSIVDNGSGRQDLVCNMSYTIYLSDNSIYTTGTVSLVFTNNSKGEFTTKPTVLSSSNILAVGNLTGDAKAEQVTKDGQKLKIKLGHNSTTLTTPQYNYSIGNAWIAKTKADGTQEIITTHQDGTNYYVSLTGVTNSNATIKGYYQLGIVPTNIITGDFNNDGFIDILISDGEVYQTLVGKSDGSFQLEGVVVNHADFTTSYVTDVDGNGTKDILAAGQRFVWMLPGESTNSSSADAQMVINFSAQGITPLDTAFGDFDGDGKTDVAVLDKNGTDVYVFYNRSYVDTATKKTVVKFEQESKLTVTLGKQLLVANFDNAFGDDISVYCVDPKGLTKPTLQTFTSNATGFAGVKASTLEKSYDLLTVGDLNNDGYVDIIAVTNGTASEKPTYHTLINNKTTSGKAIGLGKFEKGHSVNFGATTSKITAAAIGDINGDGKNDLVILDAGGKQVFVFPQSTSGVFPTTSSPVPVTGSTIDPAAFKHLALADFNADGAVDILVGAITNGGTNSTVEFRVLENDPNSKGTFKSNTNFTPVGEFTGASSSGLSFHVGLLDSNGTPDIVIVGGNTIKRFINIDKTGADIGTVTLVFRDYNSQIVNTEVVDLNNLSNRLTYIDEWSNFWVEIWANTGSTAGISEFTTSLTFDNSIFEVRDDGKHVVAGTAFGKDFKYTITGGKINISGKLSASDLQGDNTNTLLARVSFMPAKDGTGLLLNHTTNSEYLKAYDHSFSIDTTSSSLSIANNTTNMTGAPTLDNCPNVSDIPLFPVMYDFDDDGVIGVLDFMFFIEAFDKNVNDQKAPVFSRLCDFDHDGKVGVLDFMLFVQNFDKRSKALSIENPTLKVEYDLNVFPDNFYDKTLRSISAPMASTLDTDFVQGDLQSQQGAVQNAQTQALLAYVASQETKKSNDYGIDDLNPVSETERLLAEGKL